MGSIILSFVGNQDPYSDNPKEEGSIVTLLRHLIEQGKSIKKIILLCTSDTFERARLTQEWLSEEFTEIADHIETIAVNDSLSEDPVNLKLAVQEARQGLESAKKILEKGDKLELNASSGTPVMKSSWSILQAAGYAPHSSVWQVRNPKQVQTGQERVFTTDIKVLKTEFDLKIIKQQIQDFNYSGALATLKETVLFDECSQALLEYADARLAFDFDKAYKAINKLSITSNNVEYTFVQDIACLTQKQPEALLKEAYFKCLIKLYNKEYSEFLILMSTLHENLLFFLGKRKFLEKSFWKKSWNYLKEQLWSSIEKYNNAELYKYLIRQKPYLTTNGLTDSSKRVVLMLIVNYEQEFTNLRESLNYINQYYDERNDIIHELKGVSYIPEQDKLLSNLKKAIRLITPLPEINPFEKLNQIIVDSLNQSFP